MRELPIEVAEWLTSQDAAHAIEAAVEQLDGGADELAVVTMLRAAGIEPQRTSGAVTVAAGRRRARERWPLARQLLFTREALEQSSDPVVSAWRAQRLTSGWEQRSVWDLCAGVGGDAIAIARHGVEVTCVEQDEARAVLLRHNLDVAGVTADVIVADAREVEIPSPARLHADPGRRRGDRRVRALRDHQPPVGELLAAHAAHGRGGGIGITLSPGVSHEDPELGEDCEIEYLQLGEDLVEATAWFGTVRRPEVNSSATLLPSGEHRVRRGEQAAMLEIGDIGGYLIVVAPAAVRARLHDEIGAEVGARRLAAHRALLTTSTRPAHSRWYRARPVAAVLPSRARDVRAWLAADQERRPIEIVLHGARIDPARWWRELGRPSRGPRGWRLEVVRRDTDTVVVVTDASESRAT